jgi:hypothetical protein
MLGLYGIKKPGKIDNSEIKRLGKSYNIPQEDLFIIDKAYSSYIPYFDSLRFIEQHKNHNQPLQALYYDKSGYLQSFHINCYASGFPNLKWNKGKAFATFPPKQQAPLDTFITIEQQLKYFQPVSDTQQINISNYDYLIIVYWNKFMGRQSKRLIKIVQKNSKLSKDKIKIIYVNNDGMFSE